MKIFIPVLLLLLSAMPLRAQMWDPERQDTVYGNEWIDFGQYDRYFKITVAEDGVYRIPQSALPPEAANVSGAQFQLFRLGKEVPLHTSTDGVFSGSDFLEFYGRKNRGELDRHLHRNADSTLINPYYSLFTDTAAYFLTWKSGNTMARYTPVPNNLTNLPPKTTRCTYEEVVELHNTYARYKVVEDGSGLDDSFFDFKGFGGASNKKVTLKIPVNSAVTDDSATLYLTRLTRQNVAHLINVTVNNELVRRDSFTGAAFQKDTFRVTTTGFSKEVTVVVEGMAASNDRSSVVYARLIYPRLLSFDNKNAVFFSLPASTDVTYLEIEKFAASGGTPVLFDLTNRLRIEATVENNLVKIALPPSALPRDLVLVNSNSGVKTVAKMEKTAFTDYSNTDAEFVILTHRFFTDGPTNWVEEYARYRRSPEGGNFKTVIADIQQLYDQFAYGVHRSPLSVRNFGHFIQKKWRAPRYFFIIGKGREFIDVRDSVSLKEAWNSTFFVPTYGTNAADNLLLSSNLTAAPIIPVGRLAATQPDDVRKYLQKVKTYEQVQKNLPSTLEGRAWTKRIVHLSGGGTAGEQFVIKYFLETMERILESYRFGADVTTFYKKSNDVIQYSQTEGLKRLIDDGISILTFFGHSSPNIFDFNFDDPVSYSNFGKYPLMISNGCFSGNCSTSLAGIGERFVAAEDRGAIAYFASSGYGVISALAELGNNFYNELGNHLYGAGIGDILKANFEKLQFSRSVGMPELVQQTILQGDPSIKVNYHPGPDYIVDRNTVKFEPTLLNNQLPDFDFSFDLVNIGEHLRDTAIAVAIAHELPSGEKTEVVRDTVTAPAFRQNLRYTIPLQGSKSVGVNRIFITVDADNFIAELPAAAENNNTLTDDFGSAGLPFFVVSNDVIALEPENFGIADTNFVALKASTVNLFSPEQHYIFEIDTAATFNSPFLKRNILKSKGGLLSWPLPFSLSDSSVYYWRVTPDSTAQTGYRWQNSSFVYLKNSPAGWNQSHFFQFGENRFQNMQLLVSRRFGFADDLADIKIRNDILSTGQLPRYFVNGYSIEEFGGALAPRSPAVLLIAALDSLTLAPIINTGGNIYGNVVSAQNARFKAFGFTADTEANRANVINFLENVIPSGYYVVFFTGQRTDTSSYSPEAWAADSVSLGTNIFQVLEKQGATQARRLASTGSVPYALFYRKNRPEFRTDETIGTPGLILEQNSVVPLKWTNGYFETPVIGPARQWKSLHWQTSQRDTSSDQYFVDVFGLTAGKNEIPLASKLMISDTTLDFINADTFPYLKLRFIAADSARRTPVQLDFWRVLYDGVPEAALNPADVFDLQKEKLNRGEPMRLKIAIENVSRFDMDSLLMHFTLTDEQNRQQFFPQRLRPLPHCDTLTAALSLDTRQMEGRYQIFMEANPDNDQPERIHLNNLGVVHFEVEKDNLNPLLDVTFDGEHIINGALISPAPEIVMTLRDENKNVALSDTSVFELYLQLPGMPAPQRLSLADPAISFTPADVANLSKENKATLHYRPKFTADGTYHLAVRARDVADNRSGDFDYTVTFEIVTKSMISRFVNYPNPFSNATRFVYTLTGNEPPTQFKIQILTVSGRIVREISQEEIGLLRPGTHLTDFVWDGTDEFGDPLANGVYLYRVVAKKADGSDFETYQTGADAFFKNEYGKMVILR